MSQRVTTNGVARQQPWVTPWGPRCTDAWPPQVTFETYPAWRIVRVWLRQHAGIFEVEP